MQRDQQRRWRRASDVGGEWRVVALVSHRPKETCLQDREGSAGQKPWRGLAREG